jgi:hypothetical protein
MWDIEQLIAEPAGSYTNDSTLKGLRNWLELRKEGKLCFEKLSEKIHSEYPREFECNIKMYSKKKNMLKCGQILIH